MCGLLATKHKDKKLILESQMLFGARWLNLLAYRREGHQNEDQGIHICNLGQAAVQIAHSLTLAILG